MLTSPSLLHCGKCGGPSHTKGRSNIAKAELASSSASKFGTPILLRRPPRPSQVTIFIIVKVIKVISITKKGENFRCQGQVCNQQGQNSCHQGQTKSSPNTKNRHQLHHPDHLVSIKVKSVITRGKNIAIKVKSFISNVIKIFIKAKLSLSRSSLVDYTLLKQLVTI